uniref:Uncharacterized protein n=1 Tax=Ditylenchus dipsaci TaxID=166011 RepID=A0A915CLG1_9BILA
MKSGHRSQKDLFLRAIVTRATMNSLGLMLCACILLQLSLQTKSIPVAAARPKSVGSTGNNDSPFGSLTDLLKGVSKDPAMNAKLSQGMDDFIKAVLPANCHQFQQLKVNYNVLSLFQLAMPKTDFFKSFKGSIDIDPQVMKTMDELITTVLPALCRQQNPNGVTNMDNMVTQASFLSQLNKFGKMIGDKRSSSSDSRSNVHRPL